MVMNLLEELSATNPTKTRLRRWRVAVVLLTVAISFALANHVIEWSQLRATWAQLLGPDISIAPAAIELTPLAPGATCEVALSVTNHSQQPLLLTGMHTTCSCVLSDSLPAKVGPGESLPVHITIHAPETNGEFTRSAIVYTDSLAAPQLPISISGRVAGQIASIAHIESNSPTEPGVEAASTEGPEPTAVLPSPNFTSSQLPSSIQ